MYFRVGIGNVDAIMKVAFSSSTLSPPQRTRAPRPADASVPKVLSAQRPTSPLATALDAFAALQLVHQRQVSTVTSPPAPAPVEVRAPTPTAP